MEGEFCFREHKTGTSNVLAVCDAELLDKTLKYGDVDFEVCSSFYGESRADKDQVLDMLERCHVTNVVGKDIVNLLLQNDLIDNECIMWLGDVPHVQLLRM